MDRTLKCGHSLESYFTVVLFVFQFYPVCNIMENLSILALALSGVKRLMDVGSLIVFILFYQS